MQKAKTEQILSSFERINQIPRKSGHEAALADFLTQWAKGEGFETRRDAIGNIVIKVPATSGHEKSPIVVIQGHMDMVCEKRKGSNHDFMKDPIQLVYDGEWLHADNTTLGADNGIAVAMAMVAATDTEITHGPLELLFTVDEETGLTGASELDPDLIQGKILLNVDSEDEGVFTVGCAGGRDTKIRLAITTEKAPSTHEAIDLIVEGFRGGHSGVDIHLQRGNAIQVLGRLLSGILDTCDLRIASIHGGTAHNAIPRDAEAVVFVPSSEVEAVKKTVQRIDAALKSEYEKTDPKAQVRIESGAQADPASALSASCTRQTIDLILALPSGVDSFSNDIEGLVETSNNLATLRMEKGVVTFHSSQRSSVMERLDLLTRRVEAVGELCPDAEVASDKGYPAWQPNMESPLLAQCKGIYKELFHKEAVIEIIHAGLECGIIGAKCPGMDMISFGPTIKNPHSPDEKIEIATIGLVWQFMAELLTALS